MLCEMFFRFFCEEGDLRKNFADTADSELASLPLVDEKVKKLEKIVGRIVKMSKARE